MKFQEIDLTFEPIFDRIPIEIEVIFKHSFQEGKLYHRFQKITGPNFLSFAFYVDYWNFIEEWKKGLIFGENGESIEDIIPYYEAYSKGFMDGYFEFENEIKEIGQIFNQNSFPIDAIFKETKQQLHAFSSRGYFYKNDDSKEKPIPIIKKDLLYSGGLKIGRNYKAWSYIIKNPKPFIQLFREFYSSTFELYEKEFRKWNSHHEGYISPLQIVIDEIRAKGTSEPKPEPESKPESKSNPLESIWMKNPSMTVNEFLKKGQDLGLWNEEFNLIAKRKGIYGSGKELLANISIVLKGHSINEGIDHKIIGKAFCSFFKIGIKPETKNPFKQFQSGNEIQKQELKKRLK